MASSQSPDRVSPALPERPRPPRARARRIMGMLGSALLVIAFAVTFLLPQSLASAGRFIGSLFSEQTAPAAAPTTETAMVELDGDAPLFGLYTADAPVDHDQLAAAEEAAGAKAGIVAYFADASNPLDVSLLDAAAEDDTIPMLSLETHDWTNADIAAGRYDDEIRVLADKLSQFNDGDGGVVLIRLNHEMNGQWYPWSENAQGNATGDYAAAWRHLVDVVRQSGTGRTTALWVWSPNILRGASPDTMVTAYPGDAYVDYIGLTGYADTGYERTAGQTFDSSIAAIRDQVSADKPLIITESGASPGTYRTAWTRSLGPWLKDTDDIDAFVWFDFDTAEGATSDWSFSDSPDVARALRRSLDKAGVAPLPAS